MPGGVFADGQVACWDRLRRGLGLGPECWVAVFILTLPLNPADHPVLLSDVPRVSGHGIFPALHSHLQDTCVRVEVQLGDTAPFTLPFLSH